MSLSEGIVSHLWPTTHGAGYIITRIVVVAVLAGVIGVLLVAVAVILAGAVTGRSLKQ